MSVKRGVQSRDLYKLKSISNPLFSPDGDQILFTQTEVNEEDKEYYSHLFVSTKDGEKVRQYTFGKVRDTQATWSPDGESIAFLSKRTGQTEVFIMSRHGGEPRLVTNTANGVTQFIWSPDSTCLLISLALSNQEVKKEKLEEKKILEPLVIDRLFYKSDSKGFLDDKLIQAAIVTIQTGEITVLTDGKHNYAIGSWCPTGKYITLFSNRTGGANYELVTDVYLFSLESRLLERITNDGDFRLSSWSPNGEYVSFIGHLNEFKSATLSKIWIYNVRTEELTCLTSDWDVQIGDVAISDFQIGNLPRGLIWTGDSEGFYFLASDQGSTSIYYGNIEGLMYPVVLGDQHIYSFTVDVQLHQAVAGISSPDHPSDLFSINLQTGEQKQITFVNDQVLREIELVRAETLTYQAEDGTIIHGWIMIPPHVKAKQKVPLLLEIHGDPHAMYANTYFHEFQLLVAKGYAVLFTNPRGSNGYGQEFVDAVRGDYGGKDYLDLMSAIDYVIATYYFIDETRLGVTGGSYGGFMTNWIVGQTDRFKAAVTQRSICNWISFYGVSDIGYFFAEWEVLRGDKYDPNRLWNHSPIKYASNINTPLLILHSEKDYRCPIEQAEQLFITLKHQKKVTKFVRFPESNHELSRSGDPNLRIQRLEHIIKWFEEYI